MAEKGSKRDLVVKSAVRELVKDMRISDSFFDALNKAVEELVKRAAERAKANGRATLRDCDV
jgi:histone H3/H4